MSIVQKLDNWGLYFEKPGEEAPKLPADITDVSSDELGKLFTEFTSWADYCASQLVVAQLEERNALKRLEFQENKMLVTRMGAQTKGERVTTVKAEISVSPIIVELTDEHEEKYAMYKMLSMLQTNLERDLTLVSREITRRSNEHRSLRKDY